jgi:hypothetical protein
MNFFKIKTKNRLRSIGSILFTVLFMMGCSAQFGISTFTDPNVGTSNTANDSTPTGSDTNNNTEPTGPLVCDPFAAGNSAGAEFGLRGELYSDQSQASLPQNLRAQNTSHYVQPQFKVANLELNELNVWGRKFNLGFMSSSGTPLTILVNEIEMTLVEWFGFSVETHLTLTSGDAPGLYQFAILSDDASHLRVKTVEGQTEYTTFIDNEGFHPQRIKVSQGVLLFESESVKIPAQIRYFQGPREHIAMQMFFRKVPNDNSSTLADPADGITGNDLYWNTAPNPQPSTPTAAYNDFLSRGWKPLAPRNYLLQSGSNRCSDT